MTSGASHPSPASRDVFPQVVELTLLIADPGFEFYASTKCVNSVKCRCGDGCLHVVCWSSR